MLTKEKEDYLQSIYYTPFSPASVYGVDKLYDYVKEQNEQNISRKDIVQWLSKQTVYTQNRQVNRKFKRQKVIAPFIDYQCDVEKLVRIVLFWKCVHLRNSKTEQFVQVFFY